MKSQKFKPHFVKTRIIMIIDIILNTRFVWKSLQESINEQTNLNNTIEVR